MSSLFTKILEGEIPGDVLHQDQDLFVIKDINPEDTTHLLIIPKIEITGIEELGTSNIEIIGKMYIVAKILADKFNIGKGYKLMLNAGDYQEIPHIHMHMISKY